ncbi:NACHT, LRR and PYD domains-containing protein 3-like [Astyanax mexicanus]|uniref:NACHT, LRR and PYD domains-containing protein 3-like n=1 Tax=Astyanax mexicanus TaxID=7994 RepID=A0A8T2KZM4_ASTMX|nr:NACHT, LRR and PYD domains-containing protein 3-like [Astyanax mexicanus]
MLNSCLNQGCFSPESPDQKRFMVVGPAAPLVAVAGEDLILPCSLQPNISAEGMMVEWIRQHETDRQVHLYIDFEDRNRDQMESYRQRTALFKEELKKGNASLKLSALQPSDDGAYKCLITSFDWFDDVTLYVEVKGEKRHNFSSSLLMILHICCTYKLCSDGYFISALNTNSVFIQTVGKSLQQTYVVYSVGHITLKK